METWGRVMGIWPWLDQAEKGGASEQILSFGAWARSLAFAVAFSLENLSYKWEGRYSLWKACHSSTHPWGSTVPGAQQALHNTAWMQGWQTSRPMLCCSAALLFVLVDRHWEPLTLWDWGETVTGPCVLRRVYSKGWEVERGSYLMLRA